MLKLINPKRSSYYHSIISNFNNLSKPIAAGLSYGFSSEKYSWLADFLFKHNNNTFINKHTCYVSFFSDKSIMYQEYKDVTELSNQFPFFADAVREQYSPHTFELTTKQYRSISQNYSEYDLIQFLDKSDLITESYEPGNDIDHVLTVNHWLGRLPVYKALGFKCNLDKASYVGYNKYIWGYEYIVSHTLSDDYFKINIPAFKNLFCGITGDNIRNYFFSYPNDIKMLIDYKIIIDKQEITQLKNFKYEYDEIVCGTNDYDPHNPFLTFINSSDWSNTYPFRHPPDDSSNIISFYPEIKDCGRVIPKKIYARAWSDILYDTIKLIRHSGIHLKEYDDQSRISFSICKYMIRDNENLYSIQTMDPDNLSNIMLEGIDIDTERNRRHSAIVMTQPYMMVKPLSDGQIIEFSFVNEDRKPIKFENAETFYENPTMFLEIKAPYSFIKELDSKLNEHEYNTDIIHTVTIRSPDTNLFIHGTGFYNNFSNILRRQDACLDDLIGGVVGTGVRKLFWITDLADTGLYTDNKMTVSGMGYGFDVLNNGSISEFIKLYCSNYHPESSYLPDDPNHIPIPNSVSRLLNYPNYNDVQEYELFRPMLKLPGINGYIKILQKNDSFKTIRAKDGNHLVVYNVEFPFCPGSVSERIIMDFTGGYKKTQIYCKQNYIKAGSHRLYEETVYDANNDRYIYYGDKSFTFGILNVIQSDYSEIEYDGFEYPAHLIYHERPYRFLSLIRPQQEEFEKFGTYIVEFDSKEYDIRLNFLIDNKVWKFGDKYSSYIDRENPSYITDIDLSTLFQEFNHKDFNGVPDKKKWLYSYFSGFAYMIDDNYKSDIVIETWKTNNWKSLNTISTDTEKIVDKIIHNNLFIVAGTITEEKVGEITSFVVANADFYNARFDIELSDDIINSLTNGVLTNNYSNTSYHIIYAETYDYLSQYSFIKLYVKKDKATLDNELFINDTIVIDLANTPTNTYISQLNIGEARYMISKNQNFEIFSSIKYNNNYIIKYLDIDDLEQHCLFRIRVVRKKEYPADGTTMQYVGKRTLDNWPNGNYPWLNDQAFLYNKNNIQEDIKKFGITYFKLVSK